jgi:hydrogenase maturation protease
MFVVKDYEAGLSKEQLMEKVPDIHLFTVSIEEINPMTLELSQNVKNSIPELINKILLQTKKLHSKLS